MDAIQHNGATSRSQISSGSIQSLNLGSYCVDQVAELINWSNARSFSLPKRSPWVQIDTSEPPEPKNNALPNEPLNDDSMPSGPVANEDQGPEAPRDGVDIVAEADPSDEADLVVSTVQPISSVTPASSLDELSPTSQSETAPAATDQSTKGQSASTKSSSKGPTMAIHEPQSLQTHRPTAAASSESNEYMRRLESLVLDLNLQLARLTGDFSDSEANQTEWLRKRVIELSLENMALHEQLQRKS